MKTPQTIKGAILSVLALGTSYILGYLKGSGASHALAIIGRIALGAILLLTLAALAKVIVAVLLRWRGSQPPGGGGGNGPRPPRAPVPRPGGGRPPSLSAAADL